ncbi:CotY/CotZ family spore coat protein [Bacillus sp. C1]
MSCDEKKHHGVSNCVSDVVNFINELQDCATGSCPTGCEVPFLGAHHGAKVANTRPFVLFTKNGDPFSAFFTGTSTTFCRSSIFRVESVENSCAVLRVLEVFSGGSPLPPDQDPVCTFLAIPQAELRSTSSCITVDLDCFCAIQCLRDVFVSN